MTTTTFPPGSARRGSDEGRSPMTLGGAALRGGGSGFLLVAVALTIGCTLGGVAWQSALTIGLAVGASSGLGFGAMVGFVLCEARTRDERANS